MSNNDPTSTVTLRIQRFNPDIDKKPYLAEYQVTREQGMTVLDALHKVKTTQDGSVTYRRSCRHAICGSCAMNINGKNVLACHTPLREVLDKKGRVTIRPLPYLPIIKDLVVDRTSFWKQYLRVKPWLIPAADVPEKGIPHQPRRGCCAPEGRNLHHVRCLLFSLLGDRDDERVCRSPCFVEGILTRADPRDSAPEERLADLAGGDGVYRCHTIFNARACFDAAFGVAAIHHRWRRAHFAVYDQLGDDA